MSLSEIIIGVVVIVIIGVAYYFIDDSRKKGVRLCSKGCNGCPHPCHSDGTPKEEFMPKQQTIVQEVENISEAIQPDKEVQQDNQQE